MLLLKETINILQEIMVSCILKDELLEAADARKSQFKTIAVS